MVEMRCRHRKTWLLQGGVCEWCYSCGAIRIMNTSMTNNGVYPASKWQKPVGDEDNPWESFSASIKRMKK